MISAVAILVMAVACSPVGDGVTLGTATSTQPSGARIQEALQVAQQFTEARVERDIEKLAANSVEGFINGFVVLSVQEMPSEFAWQEAIGWEIALHRCQVTEADEATPTIRCDVTHSNAVSEALGVGPYEGSYHLKVRFEGDDWLGQTLTRTAVVESHQTEFPVFAFTVETWRPFAEWLEQNHPDGVDSMLGSPVLDNVGLMLEEGERRPLLTENSIDLWLQLSREFVDERATRDPEG